MSFYRTPGRPFDPNLRGDRRKRARLSSMAVRILQNYRHDVRRAYWPICAICREPVAGGFARDNGRAGELCEIELVVTCHGRTERATISNQALAAWEMAEPPLPTVPRWAFHLLIALDGREPG